MAKRTSIYLPDAVSAYLADAESVSSRIAAIILRYQRLCRESLPALSREEWCAVCDANNGCGFEDSAGEFAESIGVMLWANVHDSPGLGDKWEIDQGKLVERMQQWTYAEQVAAYEACRTFWQHSDISTDEAMIRAKMLLDPE